MNQTVGIAALNYYIPSGKITSAEMSQKSNIPEWLFTEKIGIKEKPIAATEEHPTEMGLKAALGAIEKAQIEPQDLDIIAYCGVGDYDYRFWSPAAKIQGLLEAKNACAFEVRNLCNSGNLGLHLCRNMLLADPDLDYALVICSDKLSPLINYQDSEAVSTFIMADGAVAAVLKKGEKSNKLLAYYAMTDGQLADYIKIPLGGTQIPAHLPSLDPNLNYIKVSDRQQLNTIFAQTYLQNYQRAIVKALTKSNLSLEDLDFLFTNQVKISLSHRISKAVGLNREQIYISLPKYGHLGAVDTLFGLAKTLENEQINFGDVVVLASSAAGFSWAALAIG
ncbi:MAG: 3-oxoacyl-[acyl-carrier-protein] synthase III C-terminal domain-containing protein [Pleurocapsa sp. MO_226.B13]|nr:3-oxoacyl-[acyl-carrier-protein] synthase III C-terminal domain-containing protein [Pleurocapsa sp. MO_226.B13]